MRIVIKVGTSTLAYPTGHVNLRRISRLCRVLSDFKNAGHEVILVSSGAIGMGVGKLGLDGRPDDIQGKQAAAAVGQCELMYTYDKEFSEYHHTVAQIMLLVHSEVRATVLHKHVHFLEATFVQQHGNALAGCVLALLMLLLNSLRATAYTGLGTEFNQLLDLFCLSTHLF